jgi:hypothetical protein
LLFKARDFGKMDFAVAAGEFFLTGTAEMATFEARTLFFFAAGLAGATAEAGVTGCATALSFGSVSGAFAAIGFALAPADDLVLLTFDLTGVFEAADVFFKAAF